MMYVAVIAFLLISMGMILIRAVLGPGVFDKILAANLFGTNIVLMIAVVAFANDSKSYIDIALVYAFLNFVGTMAMLRYFRYGTFRKKG